MISYQNSVTKLFNFVFLILLSLVFISCSSKNEVKQTSNNLPSWYLNPISNDGLHLYGIGEGENLQEATNNALVSISSNLIVSINSNSSLKKESILKYREYVSKEFRQNIYTETENLSFQNYEIVESFKQRYNKILVLVKAPKDLLVKQLRNELRNLNDNFRITTSLKQDNLTRYLNYEKVYFDFDYFTNKVQIINSLDNTFSDKNFYDKMRFLKSNLEDLKQKINFTIYKNNSDDFAVLRLKKSISDYGFSIKDNADYQIHLNSNFNFKDARGMFIANNDLSIEIIYDNKIIKSHKIELTGYSSNSIDDAIHNSYEDFNIDLF